MTNEPQRTSAGRLRSQRIFAIAVFLFCLSHMLIKHVVIDIFILYYSFLFHYAIFMGMDYRTETVGVTFSQYSPACKKEPADSHPNFYS